MKRRGGALALGCVLGAALSAPACAEAAFGALDPAFGAAGVATATFGETSDAHALVRLGDGRYVVAGSSALRGTEHVLLARYSALGALDPSFGAGGSVLDQFGTVTEAGQSATALAVQRDGKLLVAGDANDSWFVARYLPGGARDLPFAGGGASVSPNGPALTGNLFAAPAAIAVQSDGRIVVAGTVTDVDQPDQSRVILARYAPSGQLDPSFGSGGAMAHQFGVDSPGTSASSNAAALALLPDGRILVAGTATDRHGATVALLARYGSSGALDGSFGDHGRVAVQLGLGAPRHADTEISSLLLRADGSAVIAGDASDAAGTPAVALAAFDATGKALGAFGQRGLVRAQYGLPASARDGVASAAATVSLAPGGSLLVGVIVARSDTAPNPTRNLLAVRYGPTGRADCAARATPLRSSGPTIDRVLGLSAAAATPAGGLVLAGGRPRGRRRQVLLAGLEGAAPPPASAPVAATGHAQRVGGRATLTGVADPGCRAVRYRFDYGSSRHYGHHTATRSVHATAGPQAVAVTLTRKQGRGRLHYRLVVIAGGHAKRGRDGVLGPR